MRGSLTFADIFSGAGGLTLGFKRAGYRPLFALDADWDAMVTYTRNNPGIAWLAKDVRKVSAKELAEVKRESIDVIVAGIPCEGYSMLNRRYDPSDPRNYLFLEFIRLVRYLSPKAVLIENVPGLLRRDNGGFRRAIESLLEDLGYTVSSFELNAADYGVPQRRVRVFFVGLYKGKKFTPPPPTHGDDGKKSILDYLQGGGEGDRVKKPYRTAREAISDLPPLQPGERVEDYKSPPLTEYQQLMREGATRLYNHEAPKHPPWTVRLIEVTKQGEPIYRTFKQRIRLSWDEPSPTIPAGGVRPQWFFAHPEQPRGLTVREVARLQSFPDSYVFYGSMIKQRILVGDAVPPLLAQALAEWLAKYLKEL
jgi:DNA (cytosine-5)-methyltransferase 1